MLYYVALALLAYCVAAFFFLALFISASRADRIMSDPPAELPETPPNSNPRRLGRQSTRSDFRIAAE